MSFTFVWLVQAGFRGQHLVNSSPPSHYGLVTVQNWAFYFGKHPIQLRSVLHQPQGAAMSPFHCQKQTWIHTKVRFMLHLLEV